MGTTEIRSGGLTVIEPANGRYTTLADPSNHPSSSEKQRLGIS